jgi:hypothetical protein
LYNKAVQQGRKAERQESRNERLEGRRLKEAGTPKVEGCQSRQEFLPSCLGIPAALPFRLAAWYLADGRLGEEL